MRRAAPGRAGAARVSGAPAQPPAPAPPPRRGPPPGSSRASAARSFPCTVFTFGQTGSGKTYTLTGPPPQVGRAHTEPPRGGDGVFQGEGPSCGPAPFVCRQGNLGKAR